jgi:hypothetical protein
VLKEIKIKYKKILYNKSNLFVYNDFRLKKTNIYILTDENKKISLLNIFLFSSISSFVNKNCFCGNIIYFNIFSSFSVNLLSYGS